jgi:membrane-bound lytic murein transglycosylase B
MKRSSISVVGLMLMTVAAVAQEAAAPATPLATDCSAKATEKKLAGAALNSFMKKCERDAATTSCDTSAADKKLRGAAKKSFVTKCVKDASAH